MGNPRVLRDVSRVKARKPDQRGMAKAIDAFLAAAGVDRADPNLKGTGERVAKAWAEEFLCGYQVEPASLLTERFEVSTHADRELVVLTGLHFRSMCPHHLMPYSGTAHIAYVPGRYVLGFGRIASLLSCFSQRLLLQEELARQVTRVLMKDLKSAGAACVIEAQQTCLTHRHHGEQQHVKAHAESYEGVVREPQLRAELWARISRAG